MRFNQYIYLTFCILSGCSNKSANGPWLEQKTEMEKKRTEMGKKYEAELTRIKGEFDRLKDQDPKLCDHGKIITIQDADPHIRIQPRNIGKLRNPSRGESFYDRESFSPVRFYYHYASAASSDSTRNEKLALKVFKTVVGNAMEGFMSPIYTDLKFDGSESLPEICKLLNFVTEETDFMKPHLFGAQKMTTFWRDCIVGALRSIAKLHELGFVIFNISLKNNFNLTRDKNGKRTCILDSGGAIWTYSIYTEWMLRSNIEALMDEFGDTDLMESEDPKYIGWFNERAKQVRAESALLDKGVDVNLYKKWIKLFEEI